ncbi:MAG: zf-TFIIB domain-containing protein [Chitinispirillia bacterium]
MKKKCVRCEKEFSDKMKICPFCNMPNKIQPIKKIAYCPKCKIELVPKFFRKEELDICPKCNGLWLDTLEFETLTSPKDIYNDDSVDSVFIQEPTEVKCPDPYHECVRCNNIMNRVNFKRISGILIDICCDHGVWLDDTELIRLRSFIAAGGYFKEQDMKIYNNSKKIEKLSSDLNNVEFMQRALHRWSLRRILYSRLFNITL